GRRTAVRELPQGLSGRQRSSRAPQCLAYSRRGRRELKLEQGFQSLAGQPAQRGRTGLSGAPQRPAPRRRCAGRFRPGAPEARAGK
nr:hypothetical protein [Tanacetum cinerariifolium]